MESNNHLFGQQFTATFGQIAREFMAVACLTMSLHAAALPITRQQAMQRAQEFMNQQGDSRSVKAVTNARRLAPRPVTGQQAADPYYVFDRGQNEGFVIVSGDDQTIPVLGYTDSGTFDYEKLPPNMKEWLDGYARQLERIQAGAPVISAVIPTHPRVEPMMKSKWSQGSPYNLSCPLDAGSRSVTGCVATAMAQLLYYNREKSVTETQATIPAYETWTKKIKVAALPAGRPIDWDNMLDTYGSANDKQKKAVADLMLYCGAAAKMDYTNASSGAQSHDAYLAFANYFGYGSSVKYYSYADVPSDVEWDRIVYAEMAAGRPIYISGSNSEAGHAFVAHGYDGNLRYYINWGWGGQSDGWYYLTNLTPGDGQGIGGSSSGYNGYREIIVGIEPENYQTKAMSFADATVKQICLANWDADNDGKLTYGEAAAVASLGTVFAGQSIKSFNELYYFTSLTQLSDDAFNGCAQLTSIRLPKALLKIGERAFKDCARLSQVDFFASMKTIGEEAFSGCRSLSSMVLPDELLAIEAGTFKNCASLSAIELPVCVEKIGDEAFSGCTGLKDFTVKTFHPENIAMGVSVFGGNSMGSATLTVMQGMKAYFAAAEQWKEFGTINELRERSGGQFAELEAGKTYYIYNVGTGKYLTKGEAWGTQAVVGDEPMRFKLNHGASMPDGVYYLTSTDTGKSGTYLFRTTNDDNVGLGVQAAFVDGPSLTADARWDIQPVGDKVYTMQIPEGVANHAEGKYWGVQTDHASNAATPTYGAYADVDYASHKYNCQWQFVLYDDDVATKYDEAQVLGNLLALAKKRGVRRAEELAVYENLECSIDELLAAQRSLRKKMKLIEFADPVIRAACTSMFDTNTDGEVGYSEAAEISDLTYSFMFTRNTTLKTFDELQFFSSVPALYGNMFEGCTNLESIVLPDGLQYIYYRVFYNCKKLTKINIPEYVTLIGDNCFYGCTALQEVTVENPDPSNISLGTGVFTGVKLADCTLYVPAGSKALYEAADVWKNFGTIVETRTHAQPKYSPIEVNKSGYIYNVGMRKLLAMGEAYGTQSVVSTKGRLFQWRRSASMADDTYYLYDVATEKVVFRTNTDTRVGEGVKACFGDGTLSDKAYWKVTAAGENVYMLQVPEGVSGYVADDYLGADGNHTSNVASPTNGVYWDVAGNGNKYAQWAFITEEDLQAAQQQDNIVVQLKRMLAMAKAQDIDVRDEQVVYDNFASTNVELQAALTSVREKLHMITFTDTKAQTICLENWDADNDGELTIEEAASVTSVGEVFRNATNLKSLAELRYFTGLTEIADNAFRSCLSLHTVYLPASVRKIGQSAFTGSSGIRYLVVLNDEQFVDYNICGLPKQATVFVPASRLEEYKNDADWGARTLTEYTGKPVVTARASRQYGRTAATINVNVLGAPVEGVPETVCEEIKNAAQPVGTYPIEVKLGSIVTPGVELRNGIFTIEPYPLTISAKSYQRNVGEENPEFELEYKGFRNRETDTVFTVRPVITCVATKDSPAGEYDIVVSGAAARNYTITYVNGVLTVVGGDSDGIIQPKAATGPRRVFDLLGRPVQGAASRRAVRIIDGRKQVVGQDR